jgi:sirohydrochlorin cobaltochelatase
MGDPPHISAYVLAMHGAPPKDFPRAELEEFFRLRSRIEAAPQALPSEARGRLESLEHKLRGWPRTEANDPFFVGSMQLAAAIEQESGTKVIVGFNEFCAPRVDEALEQAASWGVRTIVILTPMLTRGGEHAEVEIPASITQARIRHPDIRFEYAWPFSVWRIARFLVSEARQLAHDHP